MLVDNFTEAKRSSELENFLARTYETNYVVNICEYVDLIDQYDFMKNEGPIKQMLAEISKNYLFEDIGFSEKNSCNWGKREAKLSPEERAIYGKDAEFAYDICILDYGYLYPIGDQKDKLMRCIKCHHKLNWNRNYTGLVCTNHNCNFQIAPMDLKRYMKSSMEDMENRMIGDLNELKTPNLVSIERVISKFNRKDNNDE